MSMSRVGIALALAACMAGCASSPPMRFYTLSPMEPGSTASSSPDGKGGVDANAPAAIRVTRVTLPGEVDRPELVRRIDANRLQLAEDDRWAAPLGEMIRRTLSANLQARVPAVAGDPEQLSVDVEEFIGAADCSVTLRAAWSLKPSDPAAPSKRGYETIRVAPTSACEVGALPEVMSRALGELSSRIVAARRT